MVPSLLRDPRLQGQPPTLNRSVIAVVVSAGDNSLYFRPHFPKACIVFDRVLRLYSMIFPSHLFCPRFFVKNTSREYANMK